MARIFTLSGWGQPHDTLKSVLRHATHVDYASERNLDAALQHIAHIGKTHEIAVGWSLGGRLLTRAIHDGLINPKRLVLVASTYQFVATPHLKLGMPADQYAKFTHNYKANPERALHKGWELIVKGDTRPALVREYLHKQDKAAVLAKDWLAWLHYLDGFTCDGMDFSGFPPTLLVHGTGDVISGIEQSQAFARAIPQSQLELWEGCGHAPHWHDAGKLKKLIDHV